MNLGDINIQSEDEEYLKSSPILVTLALYDFKARERVSEDFSYVCNANYLAAAVCKEQRTPI
jgi:hypothetical protein